MPESPIEIWDAEADTFDESADHGLRDPQVRRAWRQLLLDVLPPAPASVVDLGCGTGTLAMLLAEEGFRVDGIDFSPRMVAHAEAKTAGRPGVRILLGDAVDPPVPAASYDVVLCRHVLWAMPDPAAAVRRWLRLLTPGGMLVMVEGRWSNGGGLAAEHTVSIVESSGCPAMLTRLDDARYWGRPIEDDRYLVCARQERPGDTR